MVIVASILYWLSYVREE